MFGSAVQLHAQGSIRDLLGRLEVKVPAVCTLRRGQTRQWIFVTQKCCVDAKETLSPEAGWLEKELATALTGSRKVGGGM